MRYDLEIDFEDAVYGADREISIPRMENCPECSGSGCEKGTSKKRCTRCGGTGQQTIAQGFFSMRQPCSACGGTGCRVCKGNGWIEILGAGMVHPRVLAGCGIDPEVYSGFAFGIGLDRLTTTRYKISDIRLLFENDQRFLEQFR